MKIFVSWSGTYSKHVAELLRDWIPNVIQEAYVYVSSQDIAKGEAWPDSVRGNLSEIDLGVVVVTKTNYEAPWILFEAGALSKSVRSRMIPLLCDVDHVELSKSPLRLFQSSMVNEADVLAMKQSLNSFATTPLTDERLTVAFSKWWPDFHDQFDRLKPDAPKAAKSKSADEGVVLDALEALLTDVQGIKAQLRKDESTDLLHAYQSLIASYRDQMPDVFTSRERELLLRYRGRVRNNSRISGGYAPRSVAPPPPPPPPSEKTND